MLSKAEELPLCPVRAAASAAVGKSYRRGKNAAARLRVWLAWSLIALWSERGAANCKGRSPTGQTLIEIQKQDLFFMPLCLLATSILPFYLHKGLPGVAKYLALPRILCCFMNCLLKE